MWARPIGGAILALGVLLLGSACGDGGTGSKRAATATDGVTTTRVVKPVRSKVECLKLAEAVGEASAVVSQGMSGTLLEWDPLGDHSGFRGGDVAKDSQKFALVAAGAPDEVKAEFRLFSKTLTRLAAVVRGVNLTGITPPTPKQKAVLGPFQSKTDSRQLARAQGRLTTWFSTRCPYY